MRIKCCPRCRNLLRLSKDEVNDYNFMYCDVCSYRYVPLLLFYIRIYGAIKELNFELSLGKTCIILNYFNLILNFSLFLSEVLFFAELNFMFCEVCSCR